MAGDPALELASIELAQTEPASDEEKGAWEKELMGIHFSNDPYRVLRAAKLCQADCRSHAETVSVEMEKSDHSPSTGIITAVPTFPGEARRRARMSVTLNDQSGSATVSHLAGASTRSRWTSGRVNTPVLVYRASVRVRQDEPSVASAMSSPCLRSAVARPLNPPRPRPRVSMATGAARKLKRWLRTQSLLQPLQSQLPTPYSMSLRASLRRQHKRRRHRLSHRPARMAPTG